MWISVTLNHLLHTHPTMTSHVGIGLTQMNLKKTVLLHREDPMSSVLYTCLLLQFRVGWGMIQDIQ